MSDVVEPTEPDDLLAAEYVLGVLPHLERQTFRERLTKEPELQERVNFWDGHFASLSEDIAPVSPPANVLRELNNRLFPSVTVAGSTGVWGSLVFWRGLSFASVAVLFALTLWNVGWLDFGRGTGPVQPRTFVAQLSGETGSVELVTFVETGTAELRYNRTVGAPEAGRSFELWLIEGDKPPFSLGVLAAEPSGRIVLSDQMLSTLKGSVLAISDEPEGGSPTGSPTGSVLAVGKLSEI